MHPVEGGGHKRAKSVAGTKARACSMAEQMFDMVVKYKAWSASKNSPQRAQLSRFENYTHPISGVGDTSVVGNSGWTKAVPNQDRTAHNRCKYSPIYAILPIPSFNWNQQILCATLTTYQTSSHLLHCLGPVHKFIKVMQ